jgi:hypothetical protein
MVTVMYRRRFGGEDHLVVEQPDRTLALIPSWMADESAATAVVTVSPRLSVCRLLELRRRLDALLACPGGESASLGERGENAAGAEQATGLV